MYLVIMDDPNFEELKQVIHEHCEETGLNYNDFVDIFGPQIISPEAFDIFFENPFNSIPKMAQEMRIELLIDILTI
jgi:hypothetical protein